MDASGGDRLLGKTELSRLAVLIRETAQNSWDAKNEGARLLFGVSLRRTDFRLREDLASLLSEGRLTGLTSLRRDRKSTRLNSSHVSISYAVFCLKTIR